MIKSLLMPAILAIVVSLAGSAGYSVMQARSHHAAFLLTQDSLALVHADSAAQGDGSHDPAGDDHGEADHAPVDSSLLLENATTPADSIRALIAERQRYGAESAGAAAGSGSNTHAAPNAADHAPAAETHATPAKAGGAPATETHDTKPAADKPATVKPVVPKPIVEPASDILPERRLAKIFGAMSARDAAKVLEQMTDGDIRTILSMMGDRQAAAILTALPAPRAAAISKGAPAAPGSATP